MFAGRSARRTSSSSLQRPHRSGEASRAYLFAGAADPRRDGRAAALRFEGGLVVRDSAARRLLREKLIARQLAAAGVQPSPEVLHAAAGLEMPTARAVLRVAERLAQIAEASNGRLTSADVSRVTSVRRSTPVHRATPSGDVHFGDREKTVWDWPDLSGRIIEDLR